MASIKTKKFLFEVAMDLVEKIRTRLKYDPNTGKMFWLINTRTNPHLAGSEAGFVNSDGRVIIKIDGIAIKRARAAYIYMTGVIPEIVDHINGDPTDDRWVNLRWVNHAQNCWNKAIAFTQKQKTSGLPSGVRQLESGRYNARIGFNKNKINLGTFNSIEEAASAYVDAKQKLYGQFRRVDKNDVA